jgi:hypothetical protein
MSQGKLERFRKTGQTGKTDAMLIDRQVLSPKILSFEDICPQWSIALSHGFSTNSGLDIKEGKSCIVGEAHGFRNSAYMCSKCWEYSQSFVSSVYGNGQNGYIITDNELFECIKNEFLQHFNQKHAYKKSSIALLKHKTLKLIQNITLHLWRFPTCQSTTRVLILIGQGTTNAH